MAAAGYLAALLLLGPSAGGDGDQAQVESASPSDGPGQAAPATTTATAAPDPASVSSDAAGERTGAPSTPAGETVPAAPPASAAASDVLALGPAMPATPGSYPLRVTVDGEAVTGTYRVEAGGAAGVQVHRTELAGSGSEQELAWDGGGMALRASTDGNLGTCRWSPPVILAPASLDVGASWSTASDCTVTARGISIAIHQESSARVTGRGETDVGGRLVEVWVVERHETQTRQAGESTATSEAATSELFAPQLGLVVERQTSATMPRPDGSTQAVTVVEEIEQLPT